MRSRAGRLFFATCLVWTGAPLTGHDSLYHYAEVTFPGGGAGEIALSIHAADLESARALGADPAGSDLLWMGGRSEAELSALLAEARNFLAETFELTLDGVDITGRGRDYRLPGPASLRERPQRLDAARPGFLVAALPLAPRSGALRVRCAAGSGKRLMLVIHRPGAFPQIRDLAPGEEVQIDLSPPALTQSP